MTNLHAARDSNAEVAVDGPLNNGERAVGDLLTAAHLLASHELPALLSVHGRRLGVQDATVYLADLQQDLLVPFVDPDGPGRDESLRTLAVDSTLAGRAYQLVQALTQDLPGGQVRMWLPLMDGSDRLGVLGVVLADHSEPNDPSCCGGCASSPPSPQNSS